MTDPHCFGGNPRERRWFFNEAAKNAGATFGCLIEKQSSAIVKARKRLNGELVIFELKLALNRVLQRSAERRHPVVRQLL